LTKYLPLLTLQVAPNSQRDRQAITMANHILTSKQILYLTTLTILNILFFVFFHVLKDLWNMICIMNVEHAIHIYLLSRIQFLEWPIYIFPNLILKLYVLQELFLFKSDKIVLFHIKLNENNVFFTIICSNI
jgi:hypothetical protein